MNLVMAPFHDWKKCEREGFRTRDAHLMQEFDRHPAVKRMLVIDRPISLAEMVLMRRNRRPRKGAVVFQKGRLSVTQVTEKTFVLDLLIPEVIRPLRMRRGWTPYILGKRDVADRVRMAIRWLELDSCCLFVSAPIHVPLVKQLSPVPFVLDAQDNLLKHALYRNTPNLREYYSYCLENAAAVTTNSAENRDWFSATRKDALWIPNGVDTERFNTNDSYTRPSDMNGLSGPIVGYAGKMQEMMDVEGTLKTLRAFPDVNFVFIGKRLNPRWVAPLWKEPNAHYLGDKKYNDLPSYLAAFDICIIPYSQERQHGVDPIKFYEYLAMGKPVVTTNIGGVSKFSNYPQVRITETASKFSEPLSEFLDCLNEKKPILTKPIPDECEWRTKADAILRIMERHLAECSCAGTTQEGS